MTRGCATFIAPRGREALEDDLAAALDELLSGELTILFGRRSAFADGEPVHTSMSAGGLVVLTRTVESTRVFAVAAGGRAAPLLRGIEFQPSQEQVEVADGETWVRDEAFEPDAPCLEVAQVLVDALSKLGLDEDRHWVLVLVNGTTQNALAP